MAIVNTRFHNWSAAQIVMLVNAALFVVGAILHMGVQVGPLTEPRIVPATVVETICALALVAGALALGLVRQASERSARQTLSRLADSAVATAISGLALGAVFCGVAVVHSEMTKPK